MPEDYLRIRRGSVDTVYTNKHFPIFIIQYDKWIFLATQMSVISDPNMQQVSEPNFTVQVDITFIHGLDPSAV